MEDYAERNGKGCMKIMQSRMDRGFFAYQDEFEKKALEVLRSGWYILGKEVEAFEKAFAGYVGCAHAVGVASGLDALYLAFRALGIGKGDEVIVQANTYIASVMGVSMNGATPVFVEPDEYYGIDVDAIEEAITDRTKAVLVVHLYGQPCDMEKVTKIVKRHGLKLVEDCAQSHGACFGRQMTGSFGDIGCFSFYPSKNLGAFGDGGAITTDDAELAKKIRILRNYGSEKRYYNQVVGVNSRLDEMQAGLLSVRLSHMEELTKERKELAALYDKLLKPQDGVFEKPLKRENADHVYHQYVIRVKDNDTRTRLIEYLGKREISTIIHYPIPPHLSEAYAYLGHQRDEFPKTESFADRVLSIPIYNGMTEEEQAYVIGALNAFK